MLIRPYDTSADMVSSEGGLLPGSPDLRRLASSKSGAWLDFRKSLSPDYARAWSELILSIALMVFGFCFHLFLTARFGNVFGLKIGILFAVWIGFWLNSVLTFGHEAAHYNLASNKNRNDTLSDWTIWLFFPQSTKSYRRSHWQHHLHLGDHEDTEISYHNCLSPWFLTKALTGIHLVTLIIRYFFRKRASVQSGNSAPSSQEVRDVPLGAPSAGLVPVLRTVATHTLFVGVALSLHSYSTAIVWLFAVVFLFPFFATVRQIMEHRTATAPCETNFMQELHGPVNRLFGTDPFSHFFGAAGFNRHLLHHWDPTVSYTCFDQMETFLGETELKPSLESARSTYLSTFAMLLKEALHIDG